MRECSAMRRLVLAMLVACGGNSTSVNPDGSSSNPGQVKITLTVNSQPVAAARAVFQALDSSLVVDTMTDAAGVASAMMVGPGYVTLVVLTDSADHVQSIYVEP